METKIKYLIVTEAYYGTNKIKVFENEDLEIKFNRIVKNIEDNPDSNVTSIRVWNVGTNKWGDRYYFDRLHTVINRDHNRYLDYKLNKEYDPSNTDACIFPYD